MNKKAQHEITGFVLIVLVVAILGLIFLSLILTRGETQTKTSIEISSFLQSSMYYTSDCEEQYKYLDLEDLIKECYKDNSTKCLDNRNICKVLNNSLNELIIKGFNINKNALNKDYNLNIYFKSNSTQPREEIMKKENDFKNCDLVLGSSYFIPYSLGSINKLGNIIIELDICR